MVVEVSGTEGSPWTNRGRRLAHAVRRLASPVSPVEPTFAAAVSMSDRIDPKA